MGLALFGNQWVAATYIGTVGDVVPQQLAGRVNGIAGFGDNGAALLAVLYTGVIVDRYGWTPVFFGAGTMPFLAMASLFWCCGRSSRRFQERAGLKLMARALKGEGTRDKGEHASAFIPTQLSSIRRMRFEITRIEGLRNDLLLRIERSEIAARC